MKTRRVKKYANRRLYDEETSRYITQEELKDFILKGESVEVFDARSGKSRTREVLLQIVAEQETIGRPILSENLLLLLIRFYEHPLQQMASRYLEISLQQLQSQSSAIARQLQRSALSPAEFMTRFTQSGIDWFQQMQRAMSDAMGSGVMNEQAKKTNVTDEDSDAGSSREK